MHIWFVICLCIIVHVYDIRKTTGHVERARAHEFYLHHCHYSCSESNVYAYPNSFSLKRWKKIFSYPFFGGFIVTLKYIAAFPNAIYRPNTCMFVTIVIQQMGRLDTCILQFTYYSIEPKFIRIFHHLFISFLIWCSSFKFISASHIFDSTCLSFCFDSVRSRSRKWWRTFFIPFSALSS